MALTISDELLVAAGMNEEEARIEIACRLFAAGKLSLPGAVKWSGLTRTQMEEELLSRRIGLYSPSPEDVDRDLDTLRAMRTEP